MAQLPIEVSPSLESAVRDHARNIGKSLDEVAAGALEEYLQSCRRRLYQVATSAALVEGVYHGSIFAATVLEHADFGVGTFEGLDGEMILLDGAIYQARGNDVKRRDDNFPVPFAAVTRFHQDEIHPIQNAGSLNELEAACDAYRRSDNLFFALRVDGAFEHLRVRAVHPVAEGTRLIDAAATQLEFEFHNIEGTLVGLWSPVYSSSFSIPGYHFHFISQDRTKGGHLLDCSAKKLRVSLQLLYEYDVQLPSEGEFLRADLSKNPAADLTKAE